MNNLRYFKISEFDSPDSPRSGKYMDKEFLKKLDNIRHALGRPMIVNSGYRTEAHNTAVGGVPGSSHRKGLAADIHCPDDSYRFKLVVLALQNGISRIGIYRTFIHLDIDPDKRSNVIWNQ